MHLATPPSKPATKQIHTNIALLTPYQNRFSISNGLSYPFNASFTQSHSTGFTHQYAHLFCCQTSPIGNHSFIEANGQHYILRFSQSLAVTPITEGIVKMKVSVVSRSGREIIKGGIDLSDNATVDDLKASIQQRVKKYYTARQRLTLPQSGKGKPVVLERGKRLKDYFEKDEGKLVVVFKDLGPQVAYSTLFFWEYVGPLFIYPIFYYFPVYKYFGYPAERVIHPVQTYAMYYWCFHYAKRILETFFIHRFSHATSPLSNVFRNCCYYWTFGAVIAYFVNHPLYTPVSEKQMKIGFGLGIVCQLANFYCHILLRNLRSPEGKGGYQIPSGFLFNIVTCANYTTEIYQWLGFNIATQTVAGYTFLVVATFIMTNWALAKHRRLKKLFDGKDGRPKYPRRWVILPPFL